MVVVNATNCQPQRKERTHHITLLETVKMHLNFNFDLKYLKTIKKSQLTFLF